jgi:hypothetical protein
MLELRVFTQSGTGADALQRPLRSRFQARLTASVRLPGSGLQGGGALCPRLCHNHVSVVLHASSRVLHTGGEVET